VIAAIAANTTSVTLSAILVRHRIWKAFLTATTTVAPATQVLVHLMCDLETNKGDVW